ncbi:hypothetical protein LY08_01351 [Olleya aquimaris]|uniref:Uncharacterized protein n=1 Tax=Olleya aquimaris TaxID=639310 RepID=A0A327RHQ9_9FLAO|nr:hypothetical protein LY08_01351 [Olleya aquimaris]
MKIVARLLLFVVLLVVMVKVLDTNSNQDNVNKTTIAQVKQ